MRNENRQVRIYGLVCMLAAFGLGSVRIQAAEPTVATETIALLNDGWSGKEAALSEAETHLARARDAASADARPLYAYALVQLKCRKFREARDRVAHLGGRPTPPDRHPEPARRDW